VTEWLGRIAAWFEDEVVRPRPSVTIRPAPSTVIVPPPRFAWDEKGWRTVRERDEVHYVGNYRIWNRRRRVWQHFDGRVVGGGDGLRAYVSDPPTSIKYHRKGPCFQLTTPPWFRVHWQTRPNSVDAAILYIEEILTECINERR
jgi:hypothetical protein